MLQLQDFAQQSPTSKARDGNGPEDGLWVVIGRLVTPNVNILRCGSRNMTDFRVMCYKFQYLKTMYFRYS